jgi:hypothetical protein
MSHRWDCPEPWTARREGERAFESGAGSWRNPYKEDSPYDHGCPEAEQSWQRGYREAERREEERQFEEARQRHIEAERAQERMWEEQRQQEEQYAQEMAQQEQEQFPEEETPSAT